ncbi:hypothetical protein SDJN02_24561, partial [Cucurbita argyrosperma subsp. argyrosperma]
MRFENLEGKPDRESSMKITSASGGLELLDLNFSRFLKRSHGIIYFLEWYHLLPEQYHICETAVGVLWIFRIEGVPLEAAADSDVGGDG